MGHEQLVSHVHHFYTRLPPDDPTKTRQENIDAHVAWLKKHNRKRLVVAVIVLGFALLVGILGYRYLDKAAWVDSLFNASMILGGLGPVEPMKNSPAKIFASFYALFSGAFFLVFFAIIMQNLIDTRTQVVALSNN